MRSSFRPETTTGLFAKSSGDRRKDALSQEDGEKSPHVNNEGDETALLSYLHRRASIVLMAARRKK